MKTSAPGVGIFPLPPIEVPYRPQSHSRRVNQRYKQSLITTGLANSTIYALNNLNISFSDHSFSNFNPDSFRFSTDFSSFSDSFSSFDGDLPSISSFDSNTSSFSFQARNKFTSQQQHRALAHIYSCSSRYFHRRQETKYWSPSIGDSNLGSPSDEFIDSHYMNIDSSSDFTFSYASTSACSIPIIADRVSLPSSAGSANLINLLPPDIARIYSDPAQLLRPVDQVKPAPRAKLGCSNAEYVKLVQRLFALGMVQFTTAPKVVNGIFGVPKDGDNIRLIIDARRANAYFVDPPHVSLPTPDILSKLVAPSGKPFYVAKVDLDNFYHRLMLPEWMRPYFALPGVRAGDMGQSDIFGADTMIYPCCCTLPMGWSHSVNVGQLSHEHLLDTKTDLQPIDRINFKTDLNIDRARHQVYIDDLNLFGPDPNELSRLQSQYISAASAAGLPVKPSKVVSPSANGVECVGLEVHGTKHEVGLKVDWQV